MTAEFQIPERERPRLIRFLELGPENRAELLGALERWKPDFENDDLIESVTRSLARRPGLDERSVREVLSFLSSLYWLRASRNMSASELASALRRKAEEAEDSALVARPDVWNDAERDLATLLSLDQTLGLSTRATFLAFQAERHVHHARILTDARPVFAEGTDEAPSGFVLMHTLQVEYHQNGEDKEWFVSLDRDDLLDLKEAVTRALEKDSSLTQCLDKTGIPVLGWKDADVFSSN